MKVTKLYRLALVSVCLILAIVIAVWSSKIASTVRNRGFDAHVIAVIRTGDVDELNGLYKSGWKVDRRLSFKPGVDNVWFYPISVAAEAGNADSVQWLLDHGANPNVASSSGDTPLVETFGGGTGAHRLNCMKILVKGGADVNGSALDGNVTPLHWAVIFKDRDAALLLLSLGANPNAQDRMGNTPLHTMLLERRPWGQAEVVKALIDAGTNLNIRNRDGVSVADALKNRKEDEKVPGTDNR